MKNVKELFSNIFRDFKVHLLLSFLLSKNVNNCYKLIKIVFCAVWELILNGCYVGKYAMKSCFQKKTLEKTEFNGIAQQNEEEAFKFGALFTPL